MTDSHDFFPDRLKLVINKIGSVVKTANSCGTSEGTVRSWRNGRSDPQRQYLAPLAQAAGVSLAWLVAGEGEMVLGISESSTDAGTSGDVDLDMMQDIIEVTEEILLQQRRTLDPEKKALLIRYLYEYISLHFEEEESLDREVILKLVKLAS